MKIAYTTKQIRATFPKDTDEDIESCTCSILCQVCRNRVWFIGNLWTVPAVFNCPECGTENTKNERLNR